jgi:hypothetical protein
VTETQAPKRPVCPVCERPVTGAVICQFCTGEITKCLTEVPVLLAELEVNATRQSKTAPRAPGGRSAETPLPYGARASDAIRQLTSTLVGWARAFPSNWHPPLVHQPPPTEARTAARHLLANINRIRQHAMAEKIYDQVTSARAHAYEVIDRDPDLVPAGQCGADQDDGSRCAETLYGDPERSTVRCTACGASRELDRTWMLEGARELEWTAAEIGRVTPGITAAMVRRYAQRGLLIQRGGRRLGPERVIPTYRVGDLLDLLTATREAS